MGKLLSFILITLATLTANAKLVTLDTRPGVHQKILIENPSNPKGNLILFAGGKGKIKLGSDKYKSSLRNFRISIFVYIQPGAEMPMF